MSLAYIGPIAISFHGNPTFSWGAANGASGTRQVRVGGLLEWSQAEQLSELVANRDRRISAGPDSGVLEDVFSDDELLAPFNGWVLLTDMSVDADHSHSLSSSPVGFSLAAVLLGQRELVVVRSAQARANAYSLTPKSIVTKPFWEEDPAGTGFVISPGGTYIGGHQYDAEAHDSERVNLTETRYQSSYRGTLGPDQLASVIPIIPGE